MKRIFNYTKIGILSTFVIVCFLPEDEDAHHLKMQIRQMKGVIDELKNDLADVKEDTEGLRGRTKRVIDGVLEDRANIAQQNEEAQRLVSNMQVLQSTTKTVQEEAKGFRDSARDSSNEALAIKNATEQLHQETGALKNLVSSVYTDAQNEYNGILQQRELVDNLVSQVTDEMDETQQNVKDAAGIAAIQIRRSQQGVEGQADQAKTAVDLKVRQTEDTIRQKAIDTQARMDAFVTGTETAANIADTAIKSAAGKVQVEIEQQGLCVKTTAAGVSKAMRKAQRRIEAQAESLTKADGIFSQIQQEVEGTANDSKNEITRQADQAKTTITRKESEVNETATNITDAIGEAQRRVTGVADGAIDSIDRKAREIEDIIGQKASDAQTRMGAFVTETKTASTDAQIAVRNSKDAQIRAMQGELESLRKSFTQILDRARIEGEQVKDLIKTAADGVQREIGQQEQGVKTAAANAQQTISDAKQKVTNTADGAIVSIGQKVREIEDTIGQKANDAQTRMDAFVTETKTASTDAHTAVKNSKDAQIRAMQEELERLRESFAQILDGARIGGEQAKAAITRKINEVADQAKAVIIQAQQGVEDKANDLTKAGGVFAQAQQRITGAADNAQQTINDAKQRVTNTADGTIVSIEEDLEKLRNFLAQTRRDVTTEGEQATVTIKDTARKVLGEIGQQELGVKTAAVNATRAISAVQQEEEQVRKQAFDASLEEVRKKVSKVNLGIADTENEMRQKKAAIEEESRTILDRLNVLKLLLERGNNGLQEQIAESEEMSAKIKEADRRLTVTQAAMEEANTQLSQEQNRAQQLTQQLDVIQRELNELYAGLQQKLQRKSVAQKEARSPQDLQEDHENKISINTDGVLSFGESMVDLNKTTFTEKEELVLDECWKYFETNYSKFRSSWKSFNEGISQRTPAKQCFLGTNSSGMDKKNRFSVELKSNEKIICPQDFFCTLESIYNTFDIDKVGNDYGSKAKFLRRLGATIRTGKLINHFEGGVRGYEVFKGANLYNFGTHADIWKELRNGIIWLIDNFDEVPAKMMV